MKAQCRHVSLFCLTFLSEGHVYLSGLTLPSLLLLSLPGINDAVRWFLSPTVLPAIRVVPLALIGIHTNSLQRSLVFYVWIPVLPPFTLHSLVSGTQGVETVL